MEKSEPSACAVCSGHRFQRLYLKAGYPVLECQDCKLQFLHPQPDDATLAAIYSDQYFLAQAESPDEAKFDALKSATAALYLDALQKVQPSGKLLEIGCGRGHLLAEAQRRGFDVRGVEFSEHAAQLANRRLGADRVLSGSLDPSRFQPASFDAIVQLDVIEHVRDPLEQLRALRGLLRPDGVMLVVTPSLSSWTARGLGKNWMEYKTEHLYYFGIPSMKQALEKTGFTVLGFKANHKILSLEYLHLHFQRFPVPLFTPLFRLIQRCSPRGLFQKHLRLSASGMLVLAKLKNP